MKQYLLSVYQPDGPVPEPAVLSRIGAELDQLNAEMRAAGIWVFSGGLHDPSTASVVRSTGTDMMITDGPFAEGKEHLGGFTIIRAADLDEAFKWAEELARITTLPIEVRPFQGDVDE